MNVKELIKEKIPQEFHNTVEFSTFLKFIKENNAKNLDQVKLLVLKDIAECRRILEKEKKNNLEGTKRRLLAKHAQHLSFLQIVEKDFLEYL